MLTKQARKRDSVNKTTMSKDGLSFLPRFLDTSSAEDSASEILLVLQVQRL